MRILIIILSLLLLACEKKGSPYPIFDYYPPANVFDEGYVSKYYFHYSPDNPDADASTVVEYSMNVKLANDLYKEVAYNAGFEFIGERFYRLVDDTVFFEKGKTVDRANKTDTIPINILGNVIAVWDGENQEAYSSKFESEGKNYIYTNYQKSVSDSLILNKPAKVFYNEWHYQEEGKDSIFNQGSTKSYYVSGVGLYGSDRKGPTYKRQMELIEQMPITEFENRASHGRRRIGYINPEETLSDDSNFKICGHETRIMDYYNLDPSAEFIGGKGELRRLVLEQLDKEKLKDEIGMLTFRFVINCKGEAGRFVVNGVDFDYQKKAFSKDLITHLLQILQGLESWQDLGGNGENDAYAYITFKIDNEEITDILP